MHTGRSILSTMEPSPAAATKIRSPKATRNLLYACLCSYMGALSFGYMIGYTSPALPQMSGANGPLPDKESASWFGSIVTFGAMFGCPVAGWLVEKAGRKGTLVITAAPYIAGWGLIAGFNDVTMLCVGRFLTGLASGMVTVCAPLFVAETSVKELRGMLGSGVQLSITIGILLVNTLGLTLEWRALAVTGMIIPIVGALLALRVPDSPRMYLTQGRKADALKALTWLRGTQAEAEEECRDMEESLGLDEKISWSEFKNPELYQPLKVSIGLMVCQQLTGINVVMFYTVSIAQSAGMMSFANWAAVVIGVIQVLGTMLACVLMDRAGRRVLLLLAGAGMALACAVLGLYYNHTQGMSASEASSLGWIALVGLCAYTVAFSLGWGPIPMLVMSEIFPVKARGAASAVATFTNWTLAFLVTKEFASVEASLGMGGTFWVFAACCALGMVFVYRSVPETKGKSLEDIELYFLGRAVRGI